MRLILIWLSRASPGGLPCPAGRQPRAHRCQGLAMQTPNETRFYSGRLAKSWPPPGLDLDRPGVCQGLAMSRTVLGGRQATRPGQSRSSPGPGKLGREARRSRSPARRQASTRPACAPPWPARPPTPTRSAAGPHRRNAARGSKSPRRTGPPHAGPCRSHR